jgi:hypothetical protein
MIKVHDFGGSYRDDEIEVLGPRILKNMLECRA